MVRRADRRRRFTPEFKVEAVRLLEERLEQGYTLQRVSEELQVSPDLLRVWSKQIAASADDASAQEVFPGSGKRRLAQKDPSRGPRAALRRPPNEELVRLQREVERLRQERDFLKKAAAFFAKESR
jgi:transposase-like protein